MFILNKANGAVNECRNKDVIAVCKKDEKHYAVAATIEELQGMNATHQEPQEEAKQSEPKGEDTEGKEKAQDGIQEGSENTNEAEAGGTKEPEGVDYSNEDELNAMKVEDLRKVAKNMGIQGYGNMNKATLVQMIMNH